MRAVDQKPNNYLEWPNPQDNKLKADAADTVHGGCFRAWRRNERNLFPYGLAT